MRGQVPHCNLPGVLCNAMGRIVHLDVAAVASGGAAGPKSDAPVPAPAAATLRLALSLPWLVAMSWQGLPLTGDLPSIAEAPLAPSLVRISYALRLIDCLRRRCLPFKRQSIMFRIPSCPRRDELPRTRHCGAYAKPRR
jgi:hypothetical protein